MSTENLSAYHEALQRIRLAQESNASELDLSDLALERLPEELGDMTKLTTLRVVGCFELKRHFQPSALFKSDSAGPTACPQVTDLRPLRELNALRELNLGVRDWVEVNITGNEPPSELAD